MFFCNAGFAPWAGHGSFLFPLPPFIQVGQADKKGKKNRANDLLLPSCWVAARSELLLTPARACTKRSLQGLVFEYDLVH